MAAVSVADGADCPNAGPKDLNLMLAGYLKHDDISVVTMWLAMRRNHMSRSQTACYSQAPHLKSGTLKSSSFSITKTITMISSPAYLHHQDRSEKDSLSGHFLPCSKGGPANINCERSQPSRPLASSENTNTIPLIHEAGQAAQTPHGCMTR